MNTVNRNHLKKVVHFNGTPTKGWSLGLVHTSDRSGGSGVVSGIGIGKQFWSSVNWHNGSDGSGSEIGRKRNSSDQSDSDSVELPTPLTISLFYLHWIVITFLALSIRWFKKLLINIVVVVIVIFLRCPFGGDSITFLELSAISRRFPCTTGVRHTSGIVHNNVGPSPAKISLRLVIYMPVWAPSSGGPKGIRDAVRVRFIKHIIHGDRWGPGLRV